MCLVGRVLYRMLQFSDQQHFFLATKGQVLEMGKEHANFLESLQTHAQRVKATCEGWSYRCGDVIVRLGPLFINSRVSGTLVEVEYLPCEASPPAPSLLAEFLQDLLGESDFGDFAMPPQSSADGAESQNVHRRTSRQPMVVQYVSLLKALGHIGSSS